MHKKFEVNQTKIKDGCQSGSKVIPHDCKSVKFIDVPLKINNKNGTSFCIAGSSNLDFHLFHRFLYFHAGKNSGKCKRNLRICSPYEKFWSCDIPFL